MKRFVYIVFIVLMPLMASAQALNIISVNAVANPQHRDFVGDVERTDTIFVSGSYTTDTVESVVFNLLTFQKDPWTKLAEYSISIADINVSTLTGVIDTFLVIPEDYMLTTGELSQMLQVAVNFPATREFQNFYLKVHEKTVPREPGIIDFDALYGESAGAALVGNIDAALNYAIDGDTIVFKRADYDFEGKALTISRPVVLSGIFPDSINVDSIGAYDVKTSFRNLLTLKIQSDDVHITNLKLKAFAETGYVFVNLSHATTGMFYMGNEFRNLVLEGGRVQVFGGNGAGVLFRHVSFLEFSQGGYYLNRKWRIDEAPRFDMQKCYVKPDFDAVNFNVRAVSLDAGNTEYPIVWNQNHSTIDSCLLNGTGLGISSKTSYVNVTNCHFLGYRTDVDMIHIEEFGHHFIIDGNIFEHISPARGINIDREIQQAHDITISNNTWIGTYSWVISANSPYNVLIENNDFSEAIAKNAGDKTFDFTYDHGAELSRTKYDLPSRNIVVRNNTGLNTEHGVFAYKALAGDNSNEIDYPAAKVQLTRIDEAPVEIIDCSRHYRIKNKASGAYLCAVHGVSDLSFTHVQMADSSDTWELEFEYPYYYYLKNIGTGNSMEVYRGYTMGDYNSGAAEQLIVSQTDFFNDRAQKPRWYLRQHGDSAALSFEILPGGNERKSRLVQLNQSPELEYALENNTLVLPPEDDCTWIFEDSDTVSNSIRSGIGETIQAFLSPNPANDKLFIHFNRESGQNAMLSVYSLSGQKIESFRIDAGILRTSFSIRNYPPGLYVLNIQDTAGQHMLKFIKVTKDL